MATLSVTNTFVNGTTEVASQVNANFTDVVNFVNTNAIQKDGSTAMTGQLTLVGDPSTANNAARKGYVDKYKTKWQFTLPGAGNWVSGNTISTITITDPGYDITVWVAGSVLATANTLAYWELQTFVDATKSGGIIIPHAGGGFQTYACLGVPTNHTTGTNCVVTLVAVNQSGGGGFQTAANTGANNLFTAWYTAT